MQGQLRSGDGVEHWARALQPIRRLQTRIVLTNFSLVTQAYDAHMNLILGEVEETIYTIDESEKVIVSSL